MQFALQSTRPVPSRPAQTSSVPRPGIKADRPVCELATARL